MGRLCSGRDLGKDSFVEPATFRAMYPELERRLALKAALDRNGTFTSDLGRRVGLVSREREAREPS